MTNFMRPTATASQQSDNALFEVPENTQFTPEEIKTLVALSTTTAGFSFTTLQFHVNKAVAAQKESSSHLDGP